MVLGGGFGGLESLFYLRYQLQEQADRTLVSDEPKFEFKPNTIDIPFGQAPENFEVDLTYAMKKQSINVVRATVEFIDSDNRFLATTDGDLNYDHLVVATGAKMKSKEIPGPYEHANTVWTRLWKSGCRRLPNWTESHFALR